MHIVLTEEDLTKLKPSTRADLLAKLFPQALSPSGDNPRGYEWENTVDLTPGQVETLMAGLSPMNVTGLKVLAEHGPEVRASLMQKVGITNFGSFQASVTKRTRTVTGDRNAFLFTWDDWNDSEDNLGHYAVTEETYRSLRIYFKLD